MGTYHLRRLCRPNVLRAVGSRYLEELLLPHAEYLAARGVTLPLGGREAPLKYQALVQMFVSPDKSMPQQLLDALYFVDELATPSGMEALELLARKSGVHVAHYCDVPPAEIALQVWLQDRNLVQRAHAEMAVRRLRAFDYFQPRDDRAPQLPDPLEPKVAALERELNDCFQAKRCGRYVRIFLDQHKDSVWLYIAHGGRLRREGTVEDTGPSSICYRPEVYDAAVFVRDSGEIGVRARSNWERELYRRLLGKHLFCDERLFAGKAKFTLEPLWQYGSGALQCIDVPGLQWIRLTQLAIFRPGDVPRSENFRAEDLFASWGNNRLPFCRKDVHLTGAGFRVQVLGCRNPRCVILRPGNRAQYSRAPDRAWFERGGLRCGVSSAGKEGPVMPELKRFWPSLETLLGCATVWAHWRQLLGPEHDLTTRFFRPSGRLATFYPHPDPTRLVYRVISHGPGDHVGICDQTPQCVALSTEDLIIWELDRPALRCALAGAFGFPYDEQLLSDFPDTRCIGQYVPLAGYRFPVFLAIPSPQRDSSQVIPWLVASQETPFLLLAPTRRLMQPQGEGLLRRRNACFVSLDEATQLDERGQLTLTAVGQQAVERFRKAALPDSAGQDGMAFFPTPAEATWSRVKIRLIDGHTASITVGAAHGVYTYAQMGMANRKNATPSRQWELLRAFAAGHGLLDWRSRQADRRNQKRRELLSRCLRRFFRIDADPIARLENGWRTEFMITEAG